MASKETEGKHVVSLQIFECESLPIPAGTKSHARLARGLEERKLPVRLWWLLAIAALAALVVGLLMGRFFLS